MKKFLALALALALCLTSSLVLAKEGGKSGSGPSSTKPTEHSTVTSTESGSTSTSKPTSTPKSTKGDTAKVEAISEASTGEAAESTDSTTVETKDSEEVKTDADTESTEVETKDGEEVKTDADTTEAEKTDETTTEEKADNGKNKITKEALQQKKAERAEKKLEVKNYIKEIKELFKDADKATKKDILSEIAAAKKELKDESIGTFVKGKNVDYDKYDGVKPVIENNRTLIPVRAITETFGATVTWAEDTQTITITKDDITIVMTIGSTTATVNGVEKTLDTAPTIIKNRTLVPIRFIADALGLKTDYDEESKTVVVE